jgi:hypothetical protein
LAIGACRAVTGSVFPLIATLTGVALVVVFNIARSYRAGRLAFSDGLLYVGGAIFITIVAIVAASSTGTVHLILAPIFLIGSGAYVAYRSLDPGSPLSHGNLRYFGWFVIALGVMTAVATFLALQGTPR